MTRQLIVTADDFGLCPEVNDGILAAHRDGIVTATSVMVRRAASAETATAMRTHPRLAFGLHVDLGEWAYDPDCGWQIIDDVCDTADPDAVAGEIRRQLETFVRLAGRTPTHLDGHQHIQRDGPAAAALTRLAAELDVPLRLHHQDISYDGRFYGQGGRGEPYPEGISVEALLAILAGLPGPITELGCHPGLNVPGSVSTYAAERDQELRTLTDPAVRDAVTTGGIVLCSPAGLGHRPPQT